MQLPFALPDLYEDRLKKDLSIFQNEFWFVFKDSKLLVDENTFQPFQTDHIPLIRSLYMGTFNQTHIHTGEVSPAFEMPGALWMDLKLLWGKMDEELLALAGRAVQLVLWDRTHHFCGQCGNKTDDCVNERAKECKQCNLLAFPKICPAIMALVRKGDQILLARGSHFPTGVFSVLAGFVDPGETLEQCVKREVFEEVGLQVDNVHYFGSQSWPFPNSMMIVFTCDWKSGDIKIDPAEIEDARWFKKGNLPLLPSAISIARALIDSNI